MTLQGWEGDLVVWLPTPEARNTADKLLTKAEQGRKAAGDLENAMWNRAKALSLIHI